VTTLAPAPGKCAVDGCAITSGGECARDFVDPFDCEDYEPNEATPGGTDDAEVDLGADPIEDDRAGPLDPRGRTPWRQTGELEPLHAGQALTLEEGTVIRGAGSSVVVVPVGVPGVGKTTLLAALYEGLAAGPVDGWRFAGSLSLMGFEERAHDATVASGRAEPDTPRTPQGTGRLLLHLSLLNDTGVRLHLLLADISGEHAETLRTLDDPGDYARPLRAATCVLLMLDGARLANPAHRHAAATEARTLFKAMHSNSLIEPGTPVIVTATKWDLCLAAPDGPEGPAAVLEDLAETVQDAGRPAGILRTAARDPASHPSGPSDYDGIDKVLNYAARLPARRQITPTATPSHERLAHGYASGGLAAARHMGPFQ
jgi:hypothetical protein